MNISGMSGMSGVSRDGGGSENWETYEEGEGDVPERDATEVVLKRVMGNGTPRSAHGLGLGMTGMGMGLGKGYGMGMRAPMPRAESAFDDETF